MSDIFDFAFDYGLTYFEPPSEKKDMLSKEQYSKGNVDFYEQSLDDTLGTGISLKFKNDDDEDDKKDDVNVNVVGGSGEDQSTLSFSEMESVYDKGQISSANIYDMSIGTYGDALSKAGFADKTPFNVFGQDIYTAGVPKTAAEAKKGLERFVSKESLVNKGVKTGARLLGMNPMITSVAMGFANGKTVEDPLGNPSFRPNHFALGAIHDINMSIQYDNISAIQASLRDPKTDTRGFAQYIGGQLVSRAPGEFAYSGTGAIGLSQEELQRIDALSKGIVPSTYDYKTETGTAGTPTGKGGMYDDRGRYHDINGTYGMGPRSASEAIGKSTGLGTEKIEAILADVRSDKTKNLNVEIAKAQAANFAEAQRKQREEVERQIREEEANTSIPDDYGVTDNIYSNFQDTTPQVDYNTYYDNNDSDNNDSPGGGGSSGGDSSDMGFSTRYGGQIGQKFALGGRGEVEPAGFIEGPPEKFSDQTTIADDIPLEVKDGTFVINAPAVEYAGSDDISEMLTKAYEKVGQSIDKSGQSTTIPSREQINIMISRGEVVVPPQIAKIIGYDRLEKINNRGKKEVTRRQKQGNQEKPQARQARQGGVITLDDIKYKERYSTPSKARQETEKILRSLPLADALSIMMYEEANVLGDKGLEGVAHVFVNRADAEGYKDFGNSLINELTKRTYTKDKIFQFNALEPTKFRNTLKIFKKNKNKYLKIRNIAEEVIAGARKDFTKGALFFKNPTSSGAKDFKKKVDSGEYVETDRSKKVQGVFQHIYYRPKDFGFVTQPLPKTETGIPEGFIEIPERKSQTKPRIPESKGGSFLFRGSDYEKGGATPAF